MIAANNEVNLRAEMNECEMNNVYARRLMYQQQKGKSFVIHKYMNTSQNDEEKVDPPTPAPDAENEVENAGTIKKLSYSTFDQGNYVDFYLKTLSDNVNTAQPSTSAEVENLEANSEVLENPVRSPAPPSECLSTTTKYLEGFTPPQLSDRYIPSRLSSSWQTRFAMLPDNKCTSTKIRKNKDNCGNSSGGENCKDGVAYSSLLRNEILGANIDGFKPQHEEKRVVLQAEKNNLFQFTTPPIPEVNIESTAPYSLSPVSPSSQKLLRSPRKPTRKISRIPFKVLDAPELQDDFYLNLVDWSSQNVLSVGLGSCVYLWSACTSQVTRLCDLSTDANSITSVSWNDRGSLVAVGTHHGYVQIWDVAVSKLITKFVGHSARVGALAWNGEMLSSGSRDRMILQRDIRMFGNNPERRLPGHRQEVCGLKWSPDNQHLASGGNDNRLYVWNMHSLVPVQTYTEHVAAVKAIAWSPHHHGLLASGGGTADRCIRFWNTLTGQPMQCVDTGSQVCNLAWSKHSSELVSTHGYSQNQILVWKYPTLSQVAKLTGHSYRVLYLAMSPDGEAIVTGAGDETLRFWNVFSKVRSQRECKSVLNLFGNIR
ncbi:fizzy-related protein homolog isoform X1 [Cimex lectularius]|uniref:Fizzy-related protein homolog n=2 Tax=Cimex lectularius TaxID=79782 RepID=A0A8I6TED4_CIMLE|nr:fizzy-related protein homolog isoform X1 [Cimex lectularius]